MNNLTAKMQRFAELYVYGDPEAENVIRGNATEAYLAAYDTESRSTASGAGRRLLQRERVRERIAELQRDRRAALSDVMEEWEEQIAEAMRTLRWARTGRWPERFDGDDQAKRSAVKAAEQTLDRALGSPKQMHELNVNQRSIVVQVAGAPHAPQLEDGDEEELEGRELGSSADPYERLLGESVEYTEG